MSRSNTPPRQPSGWPKPVAQAQEANDPARQRIGFPLGRPQQETPTIYQQGTQPPAAYGFSGAADRGHYPYPPAFEGQPPADPRFQAQMAQRQGGYHSPAPHHHGHPQDPGQRMPMPPAPDPYAAHGQSAQQYGQPPQQWGHEPEPDPHAFDQGGYAPGQGGGWQQQQDPYAPAGADDLGYAAFGSQALFDSSYGQPATFAHQPGGEGVDGFAQEQAVYEPEEPRRRGGLFLVVGALVGAVAVGGGLAYGYKVLMGPDASGPPPVVKSDATPARLKPQDADGRKFPFAENKVYGRLSENAPPASPPPAAAEGSAPSSDDAADASGTRKVTTFSVGRDGTIAPPQPSSDQASATPVVPGLTLDHAPGSRPRPSGAAAVASVEPSAPAEPKQEPPATKQDPPTTTSSLQEGQPVVVSPPPARPAVIAKAPPPAAEEPAAVEEPRAKVAALPPQEPAKKAAPPKRAAQPVAAPAAAPAPDGSAGWVAVLASVPVSDSSRMDALKMFADMQQKYGAVLQDKTPDVREANLGEKGVYHRLLVGPPGSREQANAVCSGLKSAGYPSCWITAF